MTDIRYDALALGDAMVDILSPATTDLLADEGMVHGQMRVMTSEAEAARLEALMSHRNAVAGGSAANTMAGLAMLGGRAAFIGQVADDEMGDLFTRDLVAVGAAMPKPPQPGPPMTGRCLIFVTPDGERTMNTWRGASETLALTKTDETEIAAAKTILLEAYLWDQPVPRIAMRRAIEIARAAGRRIAFTLAAIRMVENNRHDLLALMADGAIDQLFANEEEVLALTRETTLNDAVAALRALVPLSVVTRGRGGALSVTADGVTEAASVDCLQLRDTTGAGDIFAAGYLAAEANGQDERSCLRLGAAAAADVICAIGARPAPGLAARLTAGGFTGADRHGMTMPQK
ncbi:adenosine kinase [Pacificimonas sp. WHA3]|uniref:Adenosine kinase n=1 Tax=Pacificimonas pallii TaxID=2827236 RepID=A0ABS6SIM5_9SPHN|nr:adenosine kinase [Pacificimonas pallii]MBV7257786.1 adenosine kinase [Pacificimonas pallii]